MEDTISISKAAKIIGVGVKTLQRWDRDNILTPVCRSATNRRFYTYTQISKHMGIRNKTEYTQTKIIAYCRVSSANQKPDLRNQRSILEEFTLVKGFANVEFIDEIGGGLNFKRKRFLEIMDAIGRHEVKTLLIAHKDRLT